MTPAPRSWEDQEIVEKLPKPGFKRSNQGHTTSESSVDSHSNEQYCDTMCLIISPEITGGCLKGTCRMFSSYLIELSGKYICSIDNFIIILIFVSKITQTFCF